MVLLPHPEYIGRFAPSPSGRLHLGSLACALASYFDAKAHNGKWLLRIEDIDPPREPLGAAQAIAQCLTSHGLHWDGDISYQSQRSVAYQNLLTQFAAQNLTFYCQCTRKKLRQKTGCYDGHCRQLNNTQGSIRLNIQQAKSMGYSSFVQFYDAIYGQKQCDLEDFGDFIVHRKDGLFAYQLAVVADDIEQGITHVVRGDDLLEATYCQLLLYKLLNHDAPNFCHIPVVRDNSGRKLSKQNSAPAIDNSTPEANLIAAMRSLGLMVPNTLNVENILAWGIAHWPALLGKLAANKGNKTSKTLT